MRILTACIALLCTLLTSVQVKAQVSTTETTDSLLTEIEQPIKVHSPSKATMYSAVLPGLGQIYNGSWYKVPVVYGGFAALGWIIRWNQNNYVLHKQAYFDVNDNDPNTKSYEKIKYFNYVLPQEKQQASEALKRATTAYRRQRDMVTIYTVGFYLLNILDANVEAHFIDFDISEELSFNIEPALLPSNVGIPAVGAQLTFKF